MEILGYETSLDLDMIKVKRGMNCCDPVLEGYEKVIEEGQKWDDFACH